MSDMLDDLKEAKEQNWGVPENPSKFSGWNAALSPVFAFAAIVATLGVTQPEIAKGILHVATFGIAFSDDEKVKENNMTADERIRANEADKPAPQQPQP